MIQPHPNLRILQKLAENQRFLRFLIKLVLNSARFFGLAKNPFQTLAETSLQAGFAATHSRSPTGSRSENLKPFFLKRRFSERERQRKQDLSEVFARA